MSKQLALMKKGFDSMLVPPDKVKEYLESGWIEVETVDMTGDETAPRSIEPVEDETLAEPEILPDFDPTEKSAGPRRKRKSK